MFRNCDTIPRVSESSKPLGAPMAKTVAPISKPRAPAIRAGCAAGDFDKSCTNSKHKSRSLSVPARKDLNANVLSLSVCLTLMSHALFKTWQLVAT